MLCCHVSLSLHVLDEYKGLLVDLCIPHLSVMLLDGGYIVYIPLLDVVYYYTYNRLFYFLAVFVGSP